jgi:bifunctional UDP-N-acetylglucosamine pyrophosphorylase / glucosamine-1-phosphate N-acetyltransferase
MKTNQPELPKTAAVILAAGRGSRMHSKNKNKVSFHLAGKPMITHTLNNLELAGLTQLIAVVGFASESVRAALGDSVTYVTQEAQLGTGDAIKQALPKLLPEIKVVLSVYGDDSAFYPPELYQEMIRRLVTTQADLLFLTVEKADPTGLGRIVRGEGGEFLRIVEERVATEEERRITEINTGFYCFKRDFLERYISQITKNPVSQEYYLTDMAEIALQNGKKVETYKADSNIWHGVNNRSDYAKARGKIAKESNTT